MECPRCKNNNVTSSHRRGIEKVLQYIWPWYSPYRCKECWTRFWIHEKKTAPMIAAGVILLLLAAFITMSVMKWQSPSETSTVSKSKLTKPAKKEGESIIDKYLAESEKAPQPAEPVPEKPPETEASPPQTVVISPPDESVKTTSVPPASEKDISDTSEEKPESVSAVPEKKTDTETPSAVTTTLSEKKPDQDAEESKKSLQRVKRIQTKDTADEFTLIIMTDEAVQKYNSFYLDAPPRLVTNLKGKWVFQGKNQIDAESDIVRKIRVGEHADFISVVADLETNKLPAPLVRELPQGLLIKIIKIRR